MPSDATQATTKAAYIIRMYCTINAIKYPIGSFASNGNLSIDNGKKINRSKIRLKAVDGKMIVRIGC